MEDTLNLCTLESASCVSTQNDDEMCAFCVNMAALKAADNIAHNLSCGRLQPSVMLSDMPHMTQLPNSHPLTLPSA